MVFPSISRLLIRQKPVLFSQIQFCLSISLFVFVSGSEEPCQVRKGSNTTQIQLMKAHKCRENRADQQCTHSVWISATQWETPFFEIME